MPRNIREEYYYWLLNMVCLTPYQCSYYSCLFRQLHSTDFIYSVQFDDNRAQDGMDLRYLFIIENNINPDDCLYCFEDDCSVLEMLVAFARRIDMDIMSGTENYNTQFWFWKMIGNLKLNTMNDDEFDVRNVQYKINKFMNRRYNYDGSNGGIFIVENPPEDMRKTELWYQMQWFLEDYI